MIPQLLIGAGVVALVVGAAILRTFGPGYRIGRLLAATPAVSVADAVALAAAGTGRYVRIEGRIDAEDEFEDEHHRPLVLRRVVLEARGGRRWRTVAVHRRVVPFVIDEELDSIVVDGDALDAGLVVIPRESAGVAADAPDAFPSELAPQTPVRMRVDQVSSIDHATVCGVPRLDEAGRPAISAGAGRPLVLTTLSRDEAMRVLARGSRIRPIAAAGALVAGTLLLALGLALGVIAAVAPASASAASLGSGSHAVVAAGGSGAAALASASPAGPSAPAASASAGPTASGGHDATVGATAAPVTGDTRTSGQTPGFVGAPVLAVLGVVLVAGATILLTLAYVRLTGGPARR